MANTDTHETAAQRRARKRTEAEAARLVNQAGQGSVTPDTDPPAGVLTDDQIAGIVAWVESEAKVQVTGTDEVGTVVGYNGDRSGEVSVDIAGEIKLFPHNALTVVTPEKAPEKKTSKNKALIPVPVDVLGDSEDVPEEEWAEAPLSVPEERDAAQLVIDKEVKEAYDKWVAAGKPHAVKSPRKRRLANPEHAPAIRMMIGKAARFHKVTAVLSKPAFNSDGKEIIVFSVRDKAPTRNRKADADLQAIRTWANSQADKNLHVNERGRISEEVKEAYYVANPDKRPADVTADKATDTGPKADEGTDEGTTPKADEGNSEG